MSTDPARKKRVRAGHRASATKIIRRIDELLVVDKPDTGKLSQLKLTLTEKLEVLKLLDAEVLDLVEEESVAEEIEQSDEFKESIYAALVRIERALAPPPSTPASTESGPRTSVTSSPSRAASRVKLPKLTIPSFSGELTAWTPFWESYQTAIHNNDELTDTEKFNYLRSYLQRTALDAISGLTLTAANYREAIAILEKRFGNKQQIISKHMDALLNVEAVASQHNLRGLRRLYDVVETHVRSLRSLGVDSGSYGGVLVSVLLGKLPPELQLMVSREIGGGEWNFDDMMKAIEGEVLARERTVSASAPTVKKTSKEPTTAATLLVGRGGGPTCTYCQQAHPSNSCGVVALVPARKQVLQRSGRCFICLRRGHISRECRSNIRCSNCRGRHHISICPNTLADSVVAAQKRTGDNDGATHPQPHNPAIGWSQSPKVSAASQQSGLNASASSFQSQSCHSTSLWVNSDRAVLLQTAQALVSNPDAPHKSRCVRIVLDCGSQRSYVTNQVAKELLLAPKGKHPLTIMTFGSSEEQSRICESVRLSLTLRNGQTKQLMLFTVPLICEPLTCQPVSFCQGNFDHLAGIDLADPSDGCSHLEVDILIGSDQYWELVTGEMRRGKSGPVAINTTLGWVLSGVASSPAQDTSSTCLVTHTLRVDGLPQNGKALDDRLKSFWELESFGISSSDYSVHDEFRSTIRFVDGKYEVELPWKEGHPALSDNYHLCARRLQGLIKRLQQDPAVLREYDTTIKEQLYRGIVERVELPAECPEEAHYLPHHAVVRRDKDTTKVRIVFDASAHSDGPSLNDCLHAGPKFNQRILDILCRFRVHRVAVTADIEKAFHMVSVAKKDRNVLRFLWFEDPFADQLDMIELRFTRVVFGVSSSPFLLNATIRHHLEQYEQTQPDLMKKLSRSLYVDDFVSGADDEDQACQMFLKSKEILRDGGFNLRKLRSNSSSVQARVDPSSISDLSAHGLGFAVESEESYANSTLGIEQSLHSGEQRVLGVRWDTYSDQFVVDLGGIISTARVLTPTKRNIVSLVGRIYDPLGFLAPVVVPFKIFFQELCEAKLDWDQLLPGNFVDRWNSLKSSLEEGQSISIPRCYFDSVLEQPVRCTLCGFCDASLKAYAGVVYLLLETRTGFSVRFVAAKTRVSPLQKLTVPRLELLSALLLARLLTSITQSLSCELQLSSPRCFTDSTVALYWIKGTDKTWKSFVQNRVIEIRKLIPPDFWMHCSGKTNPADIPSRGLSLLELSVNILWRDGPGWICEGNPTQDQECHQPEECLTELRNKDRQLVHGLLMAGNTAKLSHIMDCGNYSSLKRLLSVTALVMKFGRMLLDKVRCGGQTKSRDLKAAAEHLWILECQQVVVADKSFKHWRSQFNLFQDESGVWRCRGRIQNAAVPYSTKHPILLHKDHHLSVLLVRSAHNRVIHNGVKETLTELRSRFWIVKGRNFIKKVIHQCLVCRRHEGKPYRAPPPPPLPDFRVAEAPPFTFTGVDFAGPLYVKGDLSTKKVWICLYTCCVVRAVHLDLVPDLSTHAFIRSFKRFVARRGLPSKIVSDNAKTFQAAAKTIEGVKWIFNIPKAPWWGGIFERLVRCTKRCLRKTIGQARFSLDELLTAVTEVEMVLNSRPLSYLSADDLEEPLTPSHLIVGRRLMSAPDYSCQDSDEFEVTSDVLTKRAKYLSATINRFWERWRKEYLVGLREVHAQHKKRSHSQQLSAGDVVVIHSDNQPRCMWKLGKVEELLTGPDGEPRAAVLRVAGKGRNAKCLRRPVQRLYPLEMAPYRAQTDVAANCSSDQTSDVERDGPQPLPDESFQTDNQVKRPRRAAAAAARDQILAQAIDADDSFC